MRKTFLVLAAAAVFCAGARMGFADDAFGKLGRGAANVATGWMDVFKEMEKQADDSGPLAAVVVAPVKGLLKAIGRTAVGVYEVVTFPLPTYKPLVEPEFVWQRNP